MADTSHLSSISEEWPEDFKIIESAYKSEQGRIRAENIFLRHSLWELTKVVNELKKEVAKSSKVVSEAIALRKEVSQHAQSVADVRAILAKTDWKKFQYAVAKGRKERNTKIGE